MSVPEHVRYHNSTMFIETPPFGYESTDDRTFPLWHPSRTPPHEIKHRTMSCPSVENSTVCNRSLTPVTSQSSKAAEQKALEFAMTDVVPALFSSPKIGPHLAQQTDGSPDMSISDITGVQQAVESCDKISDTRRDNMIGVIISRGGRYKAALTCDMQRARQQQAQVACRPPQNSRPTMNTITIAVLRLHAHHRAVAAATEARISIHFCAVHNATTLSSGCS